MKKEIRVYIVDPFKLDVSYSELTDDEFIIEAEGSGRVHTLEVFQEAFNNEDVDTMEDVIRIIEVETTGDVPKKTDPDNEPIPMNEIYRIMHKRMKNAKNPELSQEIWDILQEIKFPEDY